MNAGAALTGAVNAINTNNKKAFDGLKGIAMMR
jgi:hypothetical protein